MLFAAILAPILAVSMQVGLNPAVEPAPAIPEELRELRRRMAAKQGTVTVETDRLGACLARAETDSTAAVMEADYWASGDSGFLRANALHCRGVAQAELGRWTDAAASFVEARDVVPADDAEYAARLGAMAGSAFLAGGENLQAVAVLDAARAASERAAFTALTGEIELDRARAFVALEDEVQATTALAEARQTIPLSVRAWLLSATLARRGDNISAAQTYIAQAKTLDPTDPQMLLEAGVIAISAGNEAQARAEWTALVNLPDAPAEAETAQSYLQQLDTP